MCSQSAGICFGHRRRPSTRQRTPLSHFLCAHFTMRADPTTNTDGDQQFSAFPSSFAFLAPSVFILLLLTTNISLARASSNSNEQPLQSHPFNPVYSFADPQQDASGPPLFANRPVGGNVNVGDNSSPEQFAYGENYLSNSGPPPESNLHNGQVRPGGGAKSASGTYIACSREFGNVTSKGRTPGDNGFKIKITGNPEKYTPGELYTGTWNEFFESFSFLVVPIWKWPSFHSLFCFVGLLVTCLGFQQSRLQNIHLKLICGVWFFSVHSFSPHKRANGRLSRFSFDLSLRSSVHNEQFS